MEKPVYIRDLLRRLNKTFTMIATRELEKIGITVPQMLILRQVFAEPKTIGQISKAVDLSNSTVSGIIDRLVREKLVERVRDENDRRVVWIRKTSKVKELYDSVAFFSDEFYNKLFQDFSEEELDQIVHTLETLNAKLEKES